MNTTRRKLIGSVAAYGTIALVRDRARAAEFTYKLSTVIPKPRATAVRVMDAIDKIGRDTGGRLQIDFFPGSQLGSGVETLSQLRLGAIEFILCPDPDLSTAVPVAGITSLPFIAADVKQALNIVNGAFGDYVRAAVAKAGIYRFARSWDAGFYQVENSTRPVVTPADIRGLKLRSTSAKQEVDVLKALGAVPVPLAPAEMYTSIKTHVVDGATLPVSVLESYKIYEVCKYVSATNHGWGCHSMIANTAAWQRLPKKIQDVVTRAFEDARNLSNADVQKADADAQSRLTARGMAFNSVDSQAFRKVVRDAGLYGQWKAAYPPEAWALLERQIGRELS